MAQLIVFVLNVVASPHPSGIYPRLLRRAARGGVRARASDYAKISIPSDEGNGLWSGRILVWTEIDMEGPWLDLISEDDLPEEVKGEISIPDNARPNYRTFWYVFDESKHYLYYEGRNERGERLGPTTARRVLTKLFARDFEHDRRIDVEVTIVPDEEAVSNILGMPGLKRLHIRLVRPNPDDFDQKKLRLLRRLTRNNARRMDTEYVRDAEAEALTPTEDVIDLAEVAAENGYVEGESDADGRKATYSTREHPRRVTLEVGDAETVLGKLLAFAQRSRRAQPERS